jgi:spermidine synthase
VIEPHAPAPLGAPPSWRDRGAPGSGPGDGHDEHEGTPGRQDSTPGGPGLGGGPGLPGGAARLPVRPGVGRFLVLAGVFVCAACGLVYELELVALASYLIGDSVTQASVVLSVMVFAMGIGSLAAKRLRPHAAFGFGAIEAALALVGGSSALALYAAFAWTGDWGGVWASGSRYLLVAFSLAIGLLIGAEVPLLMELIQRIRRQDAGGAIADLFAADYVGALVGGLAFPFLLLPWLGQLTGALLTGTVNALVGGTLVLGLFHHDLSRRARWLLLGANAAVLALLASAAVHVDDFERAARRAVYGKDVRVAVQTSVQEIVLTGGRHGRPLSLFLDGRLRISGRDEHRYHRALVHPAIDAGPHARVLVLGGGDGLAAREVLRHDGVRRVDVVELNGDAYDDARVHAVTADSFTWLRHTRPAAPYDVVIADLPDPGITDSAKLYSQEFYGLAREVLAEDGRLVVHAGPVASRRDVFWTVDATLRAAGLRTTPYRVVSRAPGFVTRPDRTAHTDRVPHDWGFVIATRGTAGAGRAVDLGGTGTRLGDAARVEGLPASTLVHPRYAH